MEPGGYRSKKGYLADFVITAWSVTALWYDKIFWPLDSHLSVAHITGIACSFIWMGAVIHWIIKKLLEIKGVKSRQICIQRISKKFYIACLLVLAFPALIYWIGCNPGITSTDTAMILYYAHNIGKMAIPNWHAPFYTFLLYCLIHIKDSIGFIVFVQWLFFSYVVMRGFSVLMKSGMEKRYAFLLCVILACSHNNILMVLSVWKDTIYSISLLWLTILFIELAEKTGERKRNCCELVIALVLVCFTRKNGFVPFFICMLAMIVKEKRRSFVIGVVSFICCVLIRGPLYEKMHVYEVNPGGKYAGLSQEILGVYYYSDNKLPEDVTALAEVLIEEEGVTKEGWSPYSVAAPYQLEYPVKDFLVSYVKSFFAAPDKFVKSFYCRNSKLFGYMHPQNRKKSCVNYIGFSGGNYDYYRYYPKRVYDQVTQKAENLVSRIGNVTESIKIAEAVLWQAGFWTVLLLMLAAVCWKREKKLIFSVFPCAGQMAGLILSAGWITGIIGVLCFVRR